LYKSPSVERNLDGQRLGRKGTETRERLITALEALLEHRPVRDLRVADIVREAGATPPSFYRYFGSVDDVLLAAIAERASTQPALLDLIRKPWEPEQIRARATIFAEAFLVHWEEHFALLHVRNMATDEGDARFSTLRWSTIAPLFHELAEKVRQRQADGSVPADVDPEALAGALLSSLERMGAGARQMSHTRKDYPPARMAAAMGYVIAAALGAETTVAP
jgi:AcrR family transcriptional regulator